MLWWITAALAAWPTLDKPARIGGGEHDAALVIGVEDYAFVADVPGANRNARDWYAWFTAGRRTPATRVQLLLDNEATAEEISAQAARLADQVGPEGTLWIVFIGHGAPDATGTDALLLGADVQQTARSVQSRGVSRAELLRQTNAAAERILVLDSCFSGRSPTGDALVPGLQPLVPTYATRQTAAVELTAGKSNQFAGPLPGEARPAFSYLMLGALHGWADANRDGVVTAAEAIAYTHSVLTTTVVDRQQEPQHAGPDRALAAGGTAAGPDLTVIVGRRTAPTRAALTLPSAPTSPAATLKGIGVDVAIETAYWDAVDATDNPSVSPSDTAAAWCSLASRNKGEHAYAEAAATACEQWRSFSKAQSDLWTSYQRDYEASRALLKLDRASGDQKLLALDSVQQGYADVDDWHQLRVARARDRIAAGKSASLPAFSAPPTNALKQRGQPGFMWTWQREAAENISMPMRMGAGLTTSNALAIDAQPYLAGTVGPIDFGVINIVYTADTGVAFRYYVGFAPFTVRPSKRVIGELRGSWLNPIVGVAYHNGLEEERDTRRWFEPYVANQIWLTRVIGVRVEGRMPVGVDGVAPQVLVGGLLNFAGGRWSK